MRRVYLNGTKLKSTGQAAQALQQQLGEPDGCASNLDALNDVLTAQTRPVRIVVRHHSVAAQNLGARAPLLWRVLQNAQAENPNVTVRLR